MWISHLGYRSAAKGEYQQYRDEAGADSCGVVYYGMMRRIPRCHLLAAVALSEEGAGLEWRMVAERRSD